MEGEIEGGDRPREGENKVRENDRNFQIVRIRVKVGQWTDRQQREDICKQDRRRCLLRNIILKSASSHN